MSEEKTKMRKVMTVYLTEEDLKEAILTRIGDQCEIWPDDLALEGDFLCLSGDLRVDLYKKVEVMK